MASRRAFLQQLAALIVATPVAVKTAPQIGASIGADTATYTYTDSHSDYGIAPEHAEDNWSHTDCYQVTQIGWR